MTGEMEPASPASIVIRSERLVAEISPHGAELTRLRDQDGKDLLWNGCEKCWTGRAPLLFPIVGALRNNAAVVDGKIFSMRQHGFARNKQFSVVSAAHPNAPLNSRPTMRRGNNFHSILFLKLLLSLKVRLCVSARPSSINRRARCRSRSAFTRHFAGPCPTGVHGKIMKSGSKDRNPRRFVD
jgi:D-hexose-6-phosphate mutarotase